MGSKKQTKEHLHTLAEIDKLIHEPARLLILSHLYVIEEADFLYLEQQTGLTRGNLSTHLSKLEDGGLVEIEKGYVGKIPRTVVRMKQDGRAAFASYLRQMKNVIDKLSE
ncbi:MAG: helix-turn-helix domain-containing protein [Candidatus Glassbacteria bacterium]|nr:helix-turn-helix domain-containing protein [Candidatus Glassbacteria bacterium]